MNLIFEEIGSNHSDYTYVEDLLHQAFPQNERRDDKEQRWNTDENPLFHCLLIRDKVNNIGLLTYWELGHYLYIEHLAVSADWRGRGYGTVILNRFMEEKDCPIVLEVEHPEDEQSKNRILFYQKCGLNLWTCDYLQPPYRVGDTPTPLYLMVSKGLDYVHDYDDICRNIHQVVYGVKP